MAAVVSLTGVTIKTVNRLGPVGQAEYSGAVQFHVTSDKGIEFDFSYQFTSAHDIDAMVHTSSQMLARALHEASEAARQFQPGP